jgi:hypothetical protein
MASRTRGSAGYGSSSFEKGGDDQGLGAEVGDRGVAA